MKDSMRKRDIALVFKKGATFRTRFFVFKNKSNSFNRVRVAFVFPKKCGNAVARNFHRRRIREIFRQKAGRKQGMDVLCIAKQPFSQLNESVWVGERERIITWCETF